MTEAKAQISVTKRNGLRVPLNEAKISRCVAWACDWLNVEMADVIQAANLQFYDGVTTAAIQTSLIKAAAELVSVEKPDYTFVAARLLLLTLYKEVNSDHVGEGFNSYPTLRSYIEKGVAAGRLQMALLDFDLEVLDSHIDASRDFAFDYLGMQTLTDRYFIRANPERSKKLGKLLELPQHFWMRVAMGLALNEKDTERTYWAVHFYNILSKLEFLNSTPTLFNAGTLHPQLASCFLNTVDDSISGDKLFSGIFGHFTENALLSKFAGGIGSDWTPVRGAGALIKSTSGKSSGVVPYLKIENDTAVAVNQCFAPETLIHTANGVRAIKDIKHGDLVLGISGNYRLVTDTMMYNQTDAMVEIDVKHSVDPLRVTAGHPIYGLKGVRKGESSARTFFRIMNDKLRPAWHDAGTLVEGDYVAQIIPSEVVVPDTEFPFTREDARLYGIMLGDGHCDAHSTEWGVTGIETDSHMVFVKQYLEARDIHFWKSEAHGCTQYRWAYGSGNAREASTGQFVGSTGHSLPFSSADLYGHGGKKRISRRFSHLPHSQVPYLIQGLIETDGNVSRGKEISFCTTSQLLAEGVRYQMLRMGVPVSGNRKISKAHDAVRGDGTTASFKESESWNLRIPAIPEIATLVGCKPLTKRNWIELNGYVLSRVKSVKPIDPCPFVFDMKVEGDESYMTTAALAHNGGKRNGAFAAYLEPWHPDAFGFMDLKKKVGDPRLRAHELFTAWWIPDLFMERVLEGGMWSFFDPHEHPDLHELYGVAFARRYIELEKQGAYVRQVPAMEFWRKMITSLFEEGGPWITFKDPCNLRSPQDHVGVVHCSNLCTEITLNTCQDETAVCNIGSINMAHVTRDRLPVVVKTAMRMLDNVIDLTFYASSKANFANMRHRPVGLGLMGWAEYLAKEGIDFESLEHIEVAGQVMEEISYYAIEASADLACERGAYETFEGSKWHRGILPMDTATVPFRPKLNWPALRDKVMVGMRNSNCLAIAPTATIANIAGTTQSTELAKKLIDVKENMSGYFTVIDPTVRILGSAAKSAFDVDQSYVIRAAAARQVWIDQSQSTNLFAKYGTKGSRLSEWYILAWSLGLKTTYYLNTLGKPDAEAEQAVAAPAAAAVCALGSGGPDCEACQ